MNQFLYFVTMSMLGMLGSCILARGYCILGLGVMLGCGDHVGGSEGLDIG